MKSKLLALALLAVAAAPAVADPDQERALAVQSERFDGARVEFYAKQTIIADRDAATARITIDMAHEQWDVALRSRDANAAGYWAKRHRDALADAREARERGSRFRAERDRARESFQVSANRLRNLSGV